MVAVHLSQFILKRMNMEKTPADVTKIQSKKDHTTSSTPISEANMSLARYAVIRELGRGGMGVVYQAMDTQRKQVVAVKLLLDSDMKAASAKRFMREAEISAQMSHPHIVNVYEFGTTPQCYIVMEYIEGQSFHDMLEEKNDSLRNKLEIFRQVCEAIEYAHSQKVIHRDLKPQNIMVMAGNQAKVMDFGLAKSFGMQSLRLSKTGQALGTPQYMSPEQADGKKLDYRTDIYSLGVILYKILTGRTPFEGDNIINILDQLANDKPRLPKEINPMIPSKLQAICMKCLEKAPEDRYETAQALTNDISLYLENRSAMVKEKTKTAPTSRSLKGNKKWAGVLILLALAGILLTMFMQETKQEQPNPNNIIPRENKPVPADAKTNANPPRVEDSPYRLPLEVWQACKYQYQGEAILDMTTPYWCKLPPAQQSEYAGQYQAGYAIAKGLELEKQVSLPNLPNKAKPMILRLIPPGRFWMGSPENEKGHNILLELFIEQTKMSQIELKKQLIAKYGSDLCEGPRHRVVISSPYYLSKYECTQAQWQAVMGDNPSKFKNAGPDAPVEQVTWTLVTDEKHSFCSRTGLLLPSEACWEYACRAGTTGMSYVGDFAIKGDHNAPGLSPIAWYGGNSGVSYEGGEDSGSWDDKENNHKKAGTHPVGEKRANGFGLYDTLGNVLEWCSDSPRQYRDKEEMNPTGRKNSSDCFAYRGGGWYHNVHYVRCAFRASDDLHFFGSILGFRPCMPVK